METLVSISASVAAGAILSILSFLLHRAHKRVEDAHVDVTKVRQELNDFKIEVAKGYMGKEEVREMFQQLTAQLRRIEEKLDGKADKECQ